MKLVIFGTGVLAGMVVVMATLAAVTHNKSAFVEVAVAEKASLVLPKTVFSSKLRLVFAVGVEGTGHDYLLQVDDDLFDKNAHLVRLSDIYMERYHVRSVMGNDVKFYSTSVERSKAEMREVAQQAENLPFPGTVMIIHGKYAYPDGYGPNTVMMYPDLQLLAEVAESEGVDFRVLYLQRPVQDILVADTIHRQFQNGLGNVDTTNPRIRYTEYMQVLLTDIAVMHSFLAELDPAFVVCHDFEHIGEVEQSSLIAKFLAPNADVAEPLKNSLIGMARSRNAPTENVPYNGADVVAARLQHKLDAFESALCTSTP